MVQLAVKKINGHSKRPAHSRILGADGRPLEAAYFDSAATTRVNEKHWANAAGGDFNQLIRGDLGILRRRARYEILNNSYGGGIADTLAMDIVGEFVPWPQVDSGNEAFDQELEEKFIDWTGHCDWCGQMDLAEILQMQIALQQCEAGASVTLLKRDPSVTYDVQLRLLCVDVDRLNSNGLFDSKIQDGIEFDDNGRPAAYHILKDSPNAAYMSMSMAAERVPASDVIHLYRIKRPGQTQGIPWFTPALELFAQLRRFVLYTLDAAETAAGVSGTLESDLDVGIGNDEQFDSNDIIDLERKAMLMLPSGVRMNQVKAEHPSTTFAMFKAEIINEIARCVLMPYNVAAMNSAKYNYASGRLDHQKYHRFIKTIRAWATQRFLRRVFSAWVTEAYLIDGYFQSNPTFEQAMRAIRSVAWFWSGFEHVDPVKESNANDTDLANGSTTLEDIYAAKGQDWKRKLRKRAMIAAYQKKLMEEFNLTADDMNTNRSSASADTAKEKDDEEETTQTQED